MNIYLIRHGESQGNKEGYFADSDCILTDRGRAQGLESRASIRKLGVEKILVSPYKRARETMDMLGVRGEVEKDIREVELGILENKSYYDILKTHRREAEKWVEDPINNSLPQGESLKEAYKRVEKTIERIIAEGEDVILISHEGIIKLALAYVLGSLDYFFKFKIDNLGVTKIVVEEDYSYLSYINRINY